MNVIQAARSAEAGDARRRLAAISGTGDAASIQFSENLRRASNVHKPNQPEDDLILQVMNSAEPGQFLTVSRKLAALGTEAAAQAATVSGRTAERLEATILAHLYGEMMSEESSGAYGSGSSGQYWQQMFTEKVAEATAARSPLRLAGQLGLTGDQNEGGHGTVRRVPLHRNFEVKSYAG